MTMNKPYLIRENIYCLEYIMSFGSVRSFLIIGDTKALLIDSGLGRDDLKTVLRSLTDLPIEVLYTHSDGDHVGAAHDFEISFMHPFEIKHYQKRFENPANMIEINEKYMIDVGQYHFEVIHVPGHTPGSIALIERSKGFMIGGDSFQIGPIFMFGDSRDLKTYRSTLDKVKNFKEINIIYASHHDLEFDPKMLDDLISLTDKVINQTINGEPEERFENKVKKYVYKNVSLYAK